jgi:hypothetical protein
MDQEYRPNAVQGLFVYLTILPLQFCYNNNNNNNNNNGDNDNNDNDNNNNNGSTALFC